MTMLWLLAGGWAGEVSQLGRGGGADRAHLGLTLIRAVRGCAPAARGRCHLRGQPLCTLPKIQQAALRNTPDCTASSFDQDNVQELHTGFYRVKMKWHWVCMCSTMMCRGRMRRWSWALQEAMSVSAAKVMLITSIWRRAAMTNAHVFSGPGFTIEAALQVCAGGSKAGGSEMSNGMSEGEVSLERPSDSGIVASEAETSAQGDCDQLLPSSCIIGLFPWRMMSRSKHPAPFLLMHTGDRSSLTTARATQQAMAATAEAVAKLHLQNVSAAGPPQRQLGGQAGPSSNGADSAAQEAQEDAVCGQIGQLLNPADSGYLADNEGQNFTLHQGAGKADCSNGASHKHLRSRGPTTRNSAPAL